MLVHAMVADTDCIDDADALRAASTAEVPGHRVMARSTLETFLPKFGVGHVRQLDHLSEMLVTRAWAIGAGRSSTPMTIDFDSTIRKVHGKQSQGAGVA